MVEDESRTPSRRRLLKGIGVGVPGTTVARYSGDERPRRDEQNARAEQDQPSGQPYEGGVSVIAETDTDAFFVVELGATDSFYDYNNVGPLVFETNGTIVHASSLVERNQLLNTVADVVFIAGSTATGVPVGALWNFAKWLAENDPEGDHGLELQVAPGYDPFELLVWVTGTNPAENARAYYDVQDVAGATEQRIPFYQNLIPSDEDQDDETDDASEPSLVEATICGELENEWHRSGHDHSHSHRCRDSRNRFSTENEPTVYFWVKLENVPSASYRYDWYGPDGELVHSWSNDLPSPDESTAFPERAFWAWLEVPSSAAPGTYEAAFRFDGSSIVSREFVLE